MPQQTEPSANNALGALLGTMLPTSEVRSEHTQAIVGQPGLQPDILVTAPGRSPVVVEAEYMPAANAESEAEGRLGLEVVGTGRLIESAIALRYPEEVRDADDLTDAITSAALSYCVLSDDGGQSPARFPDSGWLEGGVGDLAELIRLVSVPQRAVEQAADALERGIGRVAAVLGQLAHSRPDILPAIAGLLGMAEVEQTRRMAGAIVANAMVFHERMAGLHGVRPLSMLCSESVASPKREMLDAWTQVLKINYWPIFSIARDIVEQLPAAEASQVLRTLRNTVEDVAATGANQAHDLTGRIFQRLIADRKYLATFYTLPASAALLARLAVSKMDVDWSDADAIANLRVGDFACGTGALLSAVYDQIAVRHEHAGGDLAALHPVMMEEVLYGCDVMPSAIHITGSTLSGAQPNVGFGKTRLYTLAYGRQEDGTVRIGSLELLQSSATMTLFNTSDPALRTGSVGEETATQVIADIPDEGFDLVIMNPPFTRATNHEGAHADVTNPAFAAFGATRADQTAMGRRINQFGKDTCYDGNAGIASGFVALVDRKLRPDGILAMVLPLSVAAGLSWKGFRELLGGNYAEVTVLSIAANGKDMSFSSDTGMAECLVIARKLGTGETPDERGSFISLTKRPGGFANAGSLARNLVVLRDVRRIEDGPYGGKDLMEGDTKVAEALSAPTRSSGDTWGAVRVSDCSVAQTADALTRSKLWLPGIATPHDLSVIRLDEVGKQGLVHRDITGPAPRGPFDKVASSPTATYPSLWNHNAKNETRIICNPDSQLRVRQGMEEKAATVWATASRAHLNLDFTFGSQPLAVAFTESPSLGGSVWSDVTFQDNHFDYAFAVWSNSTLGLLSWWWSSNRQQSSKARLTIRVTESLPILDLRTLTDDQLSTAESIFNDFRDKDLMPAYLADADPNRALLDHRVVRDLLGFDHSVYQATRRLTAKWCAEPSVHGGKRRPSGAELVI